MNKRIFILFFCLVAGISTRAQDPVFDTLKSELDRNFAILKEQSVPAYYIFLRLDEIQSATAVGRLGRLQASPDSGTPSHILTSCLRVGDPTLDNTHEIRAGAGGYRDIQMEGQYVTIDNNPKVLKNAVWQQLDRLYKDDIRIYEQIKANIAVKVEQEDKSPDFSVETPEKYYESPISWESLGINRQTWDEKVRRYSSVFNENSDILDGMAVLTANMQRKIFVDTEGREIAQNSVVFQLALTAETLADDGMSLPLYKTWMSFSLAELPSDEEVLAAAAEISKTLSELKKAPVVESFTGPAILSPEAAGVFFHEIFGHRIEGSRLKQENDAQTFKKKIGENVLPKHLSVTLDPTMRYYGKTPLNGYYVFDDEGVRGQKVEVVKNGVLKDFLMSRTPIEGFFHSNGHGRAQVGAAPVSRQSNLLVESSQKLSREELVKRLRKEAKAQGKEYAYYFKDVSGGFTTTNRYMPNSFNVTPLVVYRIYTDGRPDELVRGVDLVGTPLAMFAQIVACGDEQAVFNGTCGAESGSVPVSAISPALLVKQIETQKRPKSQNQPPILPKPKADGTTANSENGGDLIHESLKKEVERGLEGLRLPGLAAPFFISYTLSDITKWNISATYGSLISSNVINSRACGSRLLIGDYNCTDENFQGRTGGNSGFDGSPCIDNDEEGLRYTVWRDLDAIYKNAAETYEQKQSAIKQLNIPAKELELPDWDKTPTVEMNSIPSAENIVDRHTLDEYVKAASAVFNDYNELFDSRVELIARKEITYFYNTEKSSYRLPKFVLVVLVSAQTQTADGEKMADHIELIFGSVAELPPLEDMKGKCRELAEKLIAETKAPKIDDSYTGPVLFEGLSVARLFYSAFFNDISLVAARKPLSDGGYSYGGNEMEEMIGKRITAKEITIEDLTGTPEYNGVKLWGYTPIDAQAVVPPAKLTIVEKGHLKTLLSDRVPTEKVPHSNGHAQSAGTTGPGVIKMSDTRAEPIDKIRQNLLSLAKEEGFDYAYVVKNLSAYSEELYKVYADGREERVRSASINDIDFRVFKKIVAVSDKELIHNFIAQEATTIIVPDAILFEDLQVLSDRIDDMSKPPVVEKEN
jgi:predicted Zn-dependent protease